MDARISKIIKGLKENDVVLVPHYFDNEEVPGRMILTKVDREVTREGFDFSFVAKNLVALHREKCLEDDRLLLPLVTKEYDKFWQIVSIFFPDKEEDYKFSISLKPKYSHYEIHVGILSAISVLEATPGYKSHAAALNIIYVNSEFIKS